MNYTREQLEAMPDIPVGLGVGDSKLKVETPTNKVWLCRNKRGPAPDRYEVIVETKQNGRWRVTMRYPV